MPGPETQRLYDAAARLRIGFALGYSELMREGGTTRRFNTMDLVGPDGKFIGRYRKMHVPGSSEPEAGMTAHLERRYFEPGNLGFPVFAYRGVTRRHGHLQRPALARDLSHALPQRRRGRADRLQHAAARSTRRRRWRICRMFHNHLPMQAGAYQNTVWVAAAAKAGLEDGQALIGGSCIIAPTGEIAAQAMSLDDEIIVHRADLDLIAACRKVNFDFAKYRRPDQYRLIADQV